MTARSNDVIVTAFPRPAAARRWWRPALAAAIVLPALAVSSVDGQERSPLAARIQAIMSRPEYRHSRFGMKFYSLGERKVIVALNEDQLFIPGSVGKIFPSATALATLGAEHRFSTRVYRTGPVTNGVLHGDLVLVASGDFNLSNRIRPDGTLAYTDVDHSYDGLPGARPVDGDPLEPIRKLAAQVAAHGIRRITGRVLVDVSLFRESTWPPGGDMIVVSPILVNDNLVDLAVTPGAEPGDPAGLRVSPETGYVRFVNRITTGPAGRPGGIQWTDAAGGPGAPHTVTVTGTVPVGTTIERAYRVPEPRRFAEIALAEALSASGVQVGGGAAPDPDFAALAASYTPGNQVAEHVSLPLSEAIKVLLKVSHNPHSAALPYVLGAVVAGERVQADAAGFGLQRKLFETAGLDLTAASQGDGAGIGSRFTPDFTVRFLEYVAQQPYADAFLHALPVMGRDGSLADVQKHAPAAGRVHAKTGTDGGRPDLVRRAALLDGKGLAGYILLPSGDKIVFGLYANFVPVADFGGMMQVGEALGEIVSAVYESLVPGDSRRSDR